MKRSREDVPQEAPITRLERSTTGTLELDDNESIKLEAGNVRFFIKEFDAGVGQVFVTTE